MHDLILVLVATSSQTPIYMHLWVQNALLEKIQEARTTKSSMGLSFVHMKKLSILCRSPSQGAPSGSSTASQ
jgi:hypothetical protein